MYSPQNHLVDSYIREETHMEPDGMDFGRLASSTNRLFEAAEPAPTDVEAEEKMSC